LTKSIILDAMECGQGTGTSSPFGIWKIRRADKGEEHASITAETPNLERDIAALIKEAGAALRQSHAGGLDFTRERSVHLNDAVDSTCGLRLKDVERAAQAISFSDARGTSTALAVVLGISAAGLFAWFWPPSFGNHDSISVVDSSDAVPGSRNKHRFGIPGISREATAGVISSVEVSVPEPSGSGHPQSVQIADKHLGSNKVAAEGQRGSSSDFVASSSARPADIPSRIPYSGTKPTTIAGWTVREVYSGMATLEGPDGIRRAARGDTVPRVGRVKAILRWDGRWIVLTSSGVISTR
jgi:hypothetical protein